MVPAPITAMLLKIWSVDVMSVPRAAWRPLSARKEIGERVIYLKWKLGRKEMSGTIELP